MRYFMTILAGMLLFVPGIVSATEEAKSTGFPLEGLAGFENIQISDDLKAILSRNGFAVQPGSKEEMYKVYEDIKKRGGAVFVSSDALLNSAHIFFDYSLRILEMTRLSGLAAELTDKLLELTRAQLEQAKDPEVKEAALLNLGYFSVARRCFDPAYRTGTEADKLADSELSKMAAHKGLESRDLLRYVDKPSLISTPYAYEDYSQYVPRGHYTRNEKFQQYFQALMWFGRIDFKLRPQKEGAGKACGEKMTLQALLITEALKNSEAYGLWKSVYEPTVYFVGKTDDLNVDDYLAVSRKIFTDAGTVDRFSDKTKLPLFIEEALKLGSPKILSGASFVEDGDFSASAKGFRLMGQRFIPDSYMFQQLVFHNQKDKLFLKYTGKGKPFTMEDIPNIGPARAFPRGLDVAAVYGSRQAQKILTAEGDTEYSDYDVLLKNLQQEMWISKKETDWKQNLYWRWIYSLLPLLTEEWKTNVPRFMQSDAWKQKELQAFLGSWTELRHDTILYAKQSYTMLGRGMSPKEPEKAYGYVEPYPEVYGRIAEMLKDLSSNLDTLKINSDGLSGKIGEFVSLLNSLKVISEKELQAKDLEESEYDLIADIGARLKALRDFPKELLDLITSETDSRMEIAADVHTDPNTKQVLEEGLGSPSSLFVIVSDGKGYRLCRGAVYSSYEFKWKMENRLTDELWQQMGKESSRPEPPAWVSGFTAK
ncbi:MAG: DUF3160 domain-containing protein [Candidatus Wallbacteria bacterium]|nr:DUF3160 domain-containing protein [Candidatus Wallbacteria bacterium]